MNNISDLMASITTILTNNNLSELSLGDIDELTDPTYVIWYDNNGSPYDDPVIKVMRDDEGLSFEVDARDFGNTVTVQDYDVDRLEWWQGIRDNILEVLQRDGTRRCPVCGKPLKGRQQFCSDTCRRSATPPPTIKEVTEVANRRIRTLVNTIIKYAPIVHAGECPEGKKYEKKDYTGKSCELCRKRYYNKQKKELIKKYIITL